MGGSEGVVDVRVEGRGEPLDEIRLRRRLGVERHVLLRIKSGVLEEDRGSRLKICDPLAGVGGERRVAVSDWDLEKFVKPVGVRPEVGEFLAAGASLVGEQRHSRVPAAQLGDRLDMRPEPGIVGQPVAAHRAVDVNANPERGPLGIEVVERPYHTEALNWSLRKPCATSPRGRRSQARSGPQQFLRRSAPPARRG